MQTYSEASSDVSTMKLRNAAIGTTMRVLGYESTARDYKRKLLAMGLTPGTTVRVKRHAPMGDPTEIEVRGFQLSLYQFFLKLHRIKGVKGAMPPCGEEVSTPLNIFSFISNWYYAKPRLMP